MSTTFAFNILAPVGALLAGAGVALATLWLLWTIYKVVMADYRALLSGRLTGIALWLSVPSLIVGLAVDWLVNWTIAAAWFHQWPRRPLELVTERLMRYLGMAPAQGVALSPADLRRRWHAELICKRLLDPYDPNPTGHSTARAAQR